MRATVKIRAGDAALFAVCAAFGESSGFSIDEGCGVDTFRAIVVSYESFDGDTWENPYFEDWRTLYEGVKLN